MTIIREGAKLGDQEFMIETGRMARQANGSVLVQYGDAQVLCTATAQRHRSHLPFFPLTANYQENMWAAGMIPGNFFRREGRPTDKATLASRLIVMRHGKVEEEGPAADLFANPKSAYTRALFAAAFNLETAPEGVVSQ